MYCLLPAYCLGTTGVSICGTFLKKISDLCYQNLCMLTIFPYVPISLWSHLLLLRPILHTFLWSCAYVRLSFRLLSLTLSNSSCHFSMCLILYSLHCTVTLQKPYRNTKGNIDRTANHFKNSGPKWVVGHIKPSVVYECFVWQNYCMFCVIVFLFVPYS